MLDLIFVRLGALLHRDERARKRSVEGVNTDNRIIPARHALRNRKIELIESRADECAHDLGGKS